MRVCPGLRPGAGVGVSVAQVPVTFSSLAPDDPDVSGGTELWPRRGARRSQALGLGLALQLAGQRPSVCPPGAFAALPSQSRLHAHLQWALDVAPPQSALFVAASGSSIPSVRPLSRKAGADLDPDLALFPRPTHSMSLRVHGRPLRRVLPAPTALVPSPHSSPHNPECQRMSVPRSDL